jgi:hypothetical protein
MKRIINVKAAISLLGASLILAAPALAKSNACSVATLQGSYGATITGTVAGLPFAELDLVTSDGHGNVSGNGTLSYNGAITPVTFTFTYTFNADCSGSAVFSNGVTQNLIITTDGSDVQFIGTNNPSAQVTGHAKRL